MTDKGKKKDKEQGDVIYEKPRITKEGELKDITALVTVMG
jgi:hypothetical protein